MSRADAAPETTPETTIATTSTGRWATALRVATAVGFAVAAAGKLSGQPEVVETFDALGWGPVPRFALAVLELLGAVALFVPRLVAAAAAAFVVLTVGALIVHLSVGGSAAFAVVMLVLSAVLVWVHRHRPPLSWLAGGRR